jgi:glutathione S-transferase
VLNWARFIGVDLGKWPALLDYYKRVTKRPAVAKALAEEFAIYEEQQKRRGAA